MVHRACPYEDALRRKMKSGARPDAELMEHILNCPTCSELFSMKYDELPVFMVPAAGRRMAVHLSELMKRWLAGNITPLLRPEPTMLGDGDFILLRTGLQVPGVDGSFELSIHVEDADFSRVRVRWLPDTPEPANDDLHLRLLDTARGSAERILREAGVVTWRVRNEKRVEIQVLVHHPRQGWELLTDVHVQGLGMSGVQSLKWGELVALLAYLIHLQVDEKAVGYPFRLLERIGDGRDRDLVRAELELWMREFGNNLSTEEIRLVTEVMGNEHN